MEWLVAHQGMLFGVLVGSLALDILLTSFNGCWYYLSGPVVYRRCGRVTNAIAPLPTPEELERDVKGVLVAKRNATVYTFRHASQRRQVRRPASASLLIGVIRFDPATASYEVQGRMGIFGLIFILAMATVFIVSRGYRDPQGVIVGSVMVLILIAFAVRDSLVCKRVAKAVALEWR